MASLFESTGKKIVGNSDCGNVMYLEEIMDSFPDTKLIMIERPIDEVIDSLTKMGEGFSNHESVYFTHDLMQDVKDAHEMLVIDYHEMNEATCRKLWNYCTTDQFDHNRWTMLNGLNIEIIPDMKLEQLHKEA